MGSTPAGPVIRVFSRMHRQHVYPDTSRRTRTQQRWGQLTWSLCLLCRRGTVTVDFTSASPQLTLSLLLRLRFVGLVSPLCALTPP